MLIHVSGYFRLTLCQTNITAIFATQYLACNVDTAVYQHVCDAEGSQQLG